MNTKKIISVITLAVLWMMGDQGTWTQEAPADTSMSFFITSTGPGNGADLGGLEGADRHCQMLADEAGAGVRTSVPAAQALTNR